MDPFGSPLFLLLVSLLPGILGSALQLRLDPDADDETLLASSQKAQPWSALLFWICLIWILVAGGRQALNYVFLVPLVLGIYFAVWTGRRRLLQERWSFPSYLGFVLRFLTGFTGPPALLALTPALVLESPDVTTAGVVAVVVLLVISHSYHRILPWVLGCHAWHPDDDLAARFREIEERSELDAVPEKALIPVGAGLVFNAFAVPHTQRPGVLFTSALAHDFPDDQLAGIHAHEVSHLEQFRRPRVRWTLEAAVLILTLGAGLGVPLLISGDDDGWWVYVLWIVLILVLLLLRGRWSHGLESQADERAVTLLGGDGESLAAGLEELHKRQRMPRRLSAEVESRMTHPSLARRLQAIRRLSGRTPARPEASGVFLSPDGRSALIFEPERLLHLRDLPDDVITSESTFDAARLVSSAPSSHSDTYGVFSELRLARDRKGRPQVAATRTDGESWQHPIRDGDVQRVVQWLDGVDGELAEAPKQPLAGPRTWRLLAILSMLLSMAAWDALPAVVLCGVLLLATGHRSAAAALGASLVGAVFVLIRNQVVESLLLPALFWMVLAVLVASTSLLFTSIVSRRAQKDGPVWPAAGFCLALGLAAVVVISMVSRTSSGFDLFALSDTVASLPSGWILLLAGAAAMATLRSRAVRTAAAMTAVAAALLAWIGLAPVRQALLPDPLYEASTPLPPWIELVEVDRWSIPQAHPDNTDLHVHITEVRVSPDGSWIAGKEWSRSEAEPYDTQTSWILTPRNRSAESQIRLADGDFEFLGPTAGIHRAVGPERALVYLDLASGERTSLPISEVFFDLAAAEGLWHLVGYDEMSDGSEYVRLTGNVNSFRGGQTDRVAHTFSPADEAGEDAFPSEWAFVEDRVVFAESRWRNETFWGSLAHSLGLRTMEPSTLLLSRSTNGSGGTDTSTQSVEPILTTRLGLDCPTQNPYSPDLFCLARDRDLTRLVRIGLDSAAGGQRIRVLASLPGEFWALDLHSAGLWTLFETGWETLLWQRSSGRVFRLPDLAEPVHGASWTLASAEGGGPRLARLDPTGDLVLYEFTVPVGP